MPPAKEKTSELEQQSIYQPTNDEQKPSSYIETDQVTSQKMNGKKQQLTYEVKNTRQVDEWSVSVLEGKQLVDPTVKTHEVLPVYQQTDGRRVSGSNYSVLNGEEVREESPSQETGLVSEHYHCYNFKGKY